MLPMLLLRKHFLPAKLSFMVMTIVFVHGDSSSVLLEVKSFLTPQKSRSYSQVTSCQFMRLRELPPSIRPVLVTSE
ncbi:uncharacterized protein C8R40DRAFT_513515 [Lentinula edodes]|uniref:uncharacterized protein n=1 Tax=Lentinula edodes TaxID=5353 RepID=UPI001E8EF146|nr:uncharacterized protein C8R40DRAFT_513515 [Lentinula edodes]KAH7871936.1 hypothetical protein C8R40DRAFT_513515 [Lentinula edodes]